MYALPWQLALRALRGYIGLETIPPGQQEAARKWALAELRRESGQDFGLNTDKWQEWFEKHEAEELAKIRATRRNDSEE